MWPPDNTMKKSELKNLIREIMATKAAVLKEDDLKKVADTVQSELKKTYTDPKLFDANYYAWLLLTPTGQQFKKTLDPAEVQQKEKPAMDLIRDLYKKHIDWAPSFGIRSAVDRYIGGVVPQAAGMGESTILLKPLVKEVVDIYDSPRITSSERKKISNELHKFSVLQGTEKVHKPGAAIKYITQALNAVGFQLDLVTGDILMGDKGQRLLTYSRLPRDPKPFSEGAQITNSRISFSWDVTSVSPTNNLEKQFEIIAYVT